MFAFERFQRGNHDLGHPDTTSWSEQTLGQGTLQLHHWTAADPIWGRLINEFQKQLVQVST